MVQEEPARGELVEVLAEYKCLSRPFSLIFPRQTVQPAALRAFVGFMRDVAKVEIG
jgi:DNA-binding transcriptional LysR family regulator